MTLEIGSSVMSELCSLVWIFFSTMKLLELMLGRGCSRIFCHILGFHIENAYTSAVYRLLAACDVKVGRQK